MEKAYTLGLYEKSMPAGLGWKEKLEAAKTAGYDFVEISIDETEEKLNRLTMSQAERLELISMMKIVGLPIRTMCLSGHRKYPLGSHDAAVREKGLDIMRKAIQLADDLGVRIIQLAGYDVYYEDSSEITRQYFLENLKIATEIAARAGVVLGFETMETEFMNTVEKSMEYVNLVASTYLNVYPDIGNITNAAKTYGINAMDDLRAGKGHLVAMHLKETVPGKFREIPFGTGHVDFESAIKTAWELGIRKYVTEFWYSGNSQWMLELYDANKRMTEILDKQS
ncbi:MULTISPECIES: L-ribulose-5-phosphate 3-epimerase [Lacrimispora]|uniref:L-ribulose-5-phosphate 3-epimerase n=1 Tax=Lacrimispora TaxID=2719231 RepID=UPI000BE46D38|nr:L-ribulose-5-phosphate 3-epimerase [Lacrimispora amygdalina]MDK2964614.1 L-ribulose-5-phosphate 3-epimerase [Lacrimispora sp.]